MNVLLWRWSLVGLILLSIFANGVMSSFDEADLSHNGTYVFQEEGNANTLVVGLTLVQAAAAKGAVCLDGSVPGYHLSRGFGSGANSWVIQLQGGAWCDSVKDCEGRKYSGYGSSTKMEKQLNFTGILSNQATENPDFYNWNKVKVRYCDGASFSGDSENKEAKLQFRGRRIFLAVIEDLMEKGMRQANQALLSGCSAGGLAAILRCDDFKSSFPLTTNAKCMSDAGFFLDAVDISGGRTLRRIYSGVVNTQGLQNTLPRTCTSRLDPTLCFFPQNIINDVKAPLFILNSAFDSWQIANNIAPPSADPKGIWQDCRNMFRCNPAQTKVLDGFKISMVNALNIFGRSRKNGVLIDTLWAHCQAERPDLWFNSRTRQGIAVDVGNWFFERKRSS